MRVERITGLDLRIGEGGWDFAREHAARIARHWGEQQARNPHLWNGDVLICAAAAIDGGILQARFAHSDYASFVAWRDWGAPDKSVRNCFGSPAVFSADGIMVFGEMGARTLNAGALYPPSGSLERRDVLADGSVDILRSIAIEIAEETGLDPAVARPGGLAVIHDAHRMAVVQPLAFPQSFAEITAIFAAHRLRTGDDELARLVAIRGAGDMDARMPPYAQEMVRRFGEWRE